MPEKVRIVKSPLIPPIKDVKDIVFSITMSNGLVITNPDQFCDKNGEEYEEDYTANLE